MSFSHLYLDETWTPGVADDAFGDFRFAVAGFLRPTGDEDDLVAKWKDLEEEHPELRRKKLSEEGAGRIADFAVAQRLCPVATFSRLTANDLAFLERRLRSMNDLMQEDLSVANWLWMMQVFFTISGALGGVACELARPTSLVVHMDPRAVADRHLDRLHAFVTSTMPARYASLGSRLSGENDPVVQGLGANLERTMQSWREGATVEFRAKGGRLSHLAHQFCRIFRGRVSGNAILKAYWEALGIPFEGGTLALARAADITRSLRLASEDLREGPPTLRGRRA